MKKKTSSRFFPLVLLSLLIITTVAFGNSPAKQAETTGIKIGFAIRTLDSPYYVALADAIKSQCEALGWEISVLDANVNTEKEAQIVMLLLLRA